MMAIRIRFDTAAGDYLQTVQISGRTYRVRAQWCRRTESWYLWFGTVEEWLVAGERVSAGGLAARRVHEDMPLGVLSWLDLDGDGDPGEDDLDERVVLLYEEDGLPVTEADEPISVGIP